MALKTGKKPTASISSVTFSGSGPVLLGPTDIVVLVGPNNSGKSISLREIEAIVSRGSGTRTMAIKGMELEKTGTAEDLLRFLENEAEFSDEVYRYGDWNLHMNAVNRWDRRYLDGGLAGGFIKSVPAGGRLAICEVQNSIAPGEQKSKPQHVLYDDSRQMARMSELFRRAFGQDIMFDFRGGSKLPIHVGELPQWDGEVDRVGEEYVEAVRAWPRLDEQGDGMKSFAGMLFETIVSAREIVLVDEPEAFLHPPQMRQLGRTLAEEVPGQLLVATHSSDVLRGFLEGTKGDLRILRMRREGNRNLVCEAQPDVLQELWEDPQLRYSNALEGVFHEQTIVCEDDSDCRLVNAIADHLEVERGEAWADTAFVPTGGKHRIPNVGGALRQVGVPVKAIFDIDFLSEESLVERAVRAFGGNWEELKQGWVRVDAAVRSGVSAKTIGEIKGEIVALLQESEESALPRGDVIDLMKRDKPWNVVKRFGVDGIPAGDAQVAYGKFRDQLEAIGIYLVPVGEIENFCRALGLHGPRFVAKLLSEKALGDPDLAELRRFVERVCLGQSSEL